ncbi:MAG: CAP domain-containing protein [Acidobacteriota bacterium]
MTRVASVALSASLLLSSVGCGAPPPSDAADTGQSSSPRPAEDGQEATPGRETAHGTVPTMPVPTMPVPTMPVVGEHPEHAMLGVVNDLRARQGLEPLEVAAPVRAAARDVIGRVFTEADVAQEVSIEAVERALQRDGYAPKQLVLAYASFEGEFGELLDVWPRQDPRTFDNFLQASLRDFALARGSAGGVPTYLAVAAVSIDTLHAPQLDVLRDIGAVRREVLRRTNAARAELGLGELTSDAALELAAQQHAEDMARRDYFAHQSPEGDDVLERATGAGYRPRLVAENLASGQMSAAEAVDGWLKSPGHRRNLLDRRAEELGVGLVVERADDGSWTVLWVQVFGAEQ